MSDKHWYFIDGRGEPQGPFTTEDIRTRQTQGELDAQTRINNAGSPHWNALSTHPEFSTGEGYPVLVYALAAIAFTLMVTLVILLTGDDSPKAEPVASTAASHASPKPALKPERKPQPSPQSKDEVDSEKLNPKSSRLAATEKIEARYITWSVDTFNLLGKTMGEFSTLMSNPKMSNPTWRLEVGMALGTMKHSYKSAKKQIAPPRFALLHSQVLAALQSYDQAADLIAKGMDLEKPPLIHAGAAKLDEALKRIAIAKKTQKRLISEQ